MTESLEQYRLIICPVTQLRPSLLPLGKIGIISRTDQLNLTLPFRIREMYRMA